MFSGSKKKTAKLPKLINDVEIYLQGAYTEVTDSRMRTLTQEEILETINTKNVSGIFMKDFNFIDLLGNIRYGDDGRIIGKQTIETG